MMVLERSDRPTPESRERQLTGQELIGPAQDLIKQAREAVIESANCRRALTNLFVRGRLGRDRKSVQWREPGNRTVSVSFDDRIRAERAHFHVESNPGSLVAREETINLRVGYEEIHRRGLPRRGEPVEALVQHSFSEAHGKRGLHHNTQTAINNVREKIREWFPSSE